MVTPEFRTTATHGDRAVPMPGVNASTCDDETLEMLRVGGYFGREGTRGTTDHADLRDRIRADALASAAPSEDAIRAAKYEALQEAVGELSRAGYPGDAIVALRVIASRYAPRPRYAPPVMLSAPGVTFGQVGPDLFRYSAPIGNKDEPAAVWHVESFNPRDGALVLSVLDGAERAR